MSAQAQHKTHLNLLNYMRIGYNLYLCGVVDNDRIRIQMHCSYICMRGRKGVVQFCISFYMRLMCDWQIYWMC